MNFILFKSFFVSPGNYHCQNLDVRMQMVQKCQKNCLKKLIRFAAANTIRLN